MTTAVIAFAPAHAAREAARHMSRSDFDRIVAEHRKPLMRYVLRMARGDQHFAEDIVQETLLRVWQRPKTITTEHSSIRPWLFTVARHLVCDHKRRRSARPAEILGESEVEKPVAADHMDEALAAHDMKTALSRLSTVHQDVLISVYYRGKSLADTATALGVPLGTVKSRVYYALRALRVIVDELGLRSGHGAAGELSRAS